MNISEKMTIGSIAVYIWKHCLPKDVPKLDKATQHLLWAKANKGGFAGPLGSFDTVTAAMWFIFKVDVTSLYPSAAKNIRYETKAGWQEPLKGFYMGFPDPSIHSVYNKNGGWRDFDYKGRAMEEVDFNMLQHQHGLVRIRFDQTALGFPYFLVSMKCGTNQTLAPVMKGEGYFITPQ